MASGCVMTNEAIQAFIQANWLSQVMTLLLVGIVGFLLYRRDRAKREARQEEARLKQEEKDAERTANLALMQAENTKYMDRISQEMMRQSQQHTQKLEEIRQESETRTAERIGEVLKSQISIISEQLQINKQFAAQVSAFDATIRSLSELTSNAIAATKENATAIHATGEALQRTIHDSDARHLRMLEEAHAFRKEQAATIQAIPDRIESKLAPAIEAMSLAVRGIAGSLKDVGDRLDLVHTLSRSQADTNAGLVDALKQIARSLDTVERSVRTVDARAADLVKQVSDMQKSQVLPPLSEIAPVIPPGPNPVSGGDGL